MDEASLICFVGIVITIIAIVLYVNNNTRKFYENENSRKDRFRRLLVETVCPNCKSKGIEVYKRIVGEGEKDEEVDWYSGGVDGVTTITSKYYVQENYNQCKTCGHKFDFNETHTSGWFTGVRKVDENS